MSYRSNITKYMPFIILIFVLMMSVGYAVINSVTFDIQGESNAKTQDGVFITSVNDLASTGNEKYETNLAYQTILDSDIVLDNNINSTQTIEVSLYNSTDYIYEFNGVKFQEDLESTYSNENIIFSYDKENYILEPGKSVTINLTFKYKENANILNNTLDSILNFDFQIYKTVIISFDGNGGSINAEPKEVVYNNTYGKLPVPIRDGYTFSGWSLEKNGKELITENTIVNTDTDHILYAQWNAKSYIIRYHANGGEGIMTEQAIKYDALVPLSKNTFTKAGYNFYGWSKTIDGEKDYNDTDNVVNLELDGVIDLYALWVEDSYKVTFDYNGGSGSVETTQVLYGTEYGSLPEYPYKKDMIFTGWYTESSGGKQILSNSKVNIKDDHTLYAQWESYSYNTAIRDMVIKNVPDENFDGIIDAIYLSFKCSSSFEKYNIPIKNLVVGQKYKLKFVVSNNAQFGTIESGYKNSLFGSMITTESTLSEGSIKTEVIADGGLIANWDDRTKGDAWLNGPFEKEMEFTAEASTMYWTWDFGLMKDDILYEYNITNIVLEPVLPKIRFADKSLVVHDTSKAEVLNDVSTTYESKFTFYGTSYAETLYYPITDLTIGSTYSITFEHLYTGSLIDDSANTSTLRYEYGTGIMDSTPTTFGSFMSSIGTYISNTHVTKTVTGNKETITLTFTPSKSTVYWVWNMANCKDNYSNLINIKVTKFSASHKNGGEITYYSGD